MTKPVNIVCMKWGTLYGPEYVNRLYALTLRNFTHPFRCMCFTDDSTGFFEGIERSPIPEMRVDPSYEKHDENTQHWVDVRRIEQTYLSHQLGVERLTYWLAEWCVSFKKHRLPREPFYALNRFISSSTSENARFTLFHGNPYPYEVLEGKWWRKWFKGLRSATWIAKY